MVGDVVLEEAEGCGGCFACAFCINQREGKCNRAKRGYGTDSYIDYSLVVLVPRVWDVGFAIHGYFGR